MVLVRVKSHKRRGHSIRGYTRQNLDNRGGFGNKRRRPHINRTIYLQNKRGRFIGRKSVAGRGDGTGIVREDGVGRIIGRTSSVERVRQRRRR